jgi:hypothetical protein
VREDDEDEDEDAAEDADAAAAAGGGDGCSQGSDGYGYSGGCSQGSDGGGGGGGGCSQGSDGTGPGAAAPSRPPPAAEARKNLFVCEVEALLPQVAPFVILLLLCSCSTCQVIEVCVATVFQPRAGAAAKACSRDSHCYTYVNR